jgi:hypothetical protein
MSMTPVVLVSLPNLPYFLGTFDTSNFKSWWRSNAIPDDIDSITKGFHIYGRTHLAIAKRTDGRWAIYRSKNYGIDWARVFLAASGEKIYDIVLITFGWAIVNTSTGFYETVNAGTTWTKISSLPGATATPAFCNIGGGDVLMCTDGRYIWRSTDKARHWTLVCDQHTIYRTDFHGLYGYYTGPSLPCICGANGRVYAASGPFLSRSDDGGLTFDRVAYWEYYPGLASAEARPPKAIVYDRMWNLRNPGFLISQILISSVDGPLGDDVVCILKINDLYPVSGYDDLYAWTFKTWTMDAAYAKNANWKVIFQQYLTPNIEEQHLSSYDVAVLGANYNDKLTISAQTKIVNGKKVVSIKYSVDGGITWTDVDLDKIKIGDPNGGGSSAGSMMDDNFAKLTWVGSACNNAGHYDYVELSRRQCQSYEIDANIEASKPQGKLKNYNVDAVVRKRSTKVGSVDAIVKACIHKSYNIDTLAQGRSTKSYRIDRTCEGTSTKVESVDAIVEKDQAVIESLDVVAQGRPKRYYLMAAYLRSKSSASYLCDAILVKDGSTETVQKMIAKFPQFMDLVDPGLPYEVYDSRKASS